MHRIFFPGLFQYNRYTKVISYLIKEHGQQGMWGTKNKVLKGTPPRTLFVLNQTRKTEVIDRGVTNW